MDIDPLTVFAVGGVASLLIERFFYYRSKYKEKRIEILPSESEESDNPGHPTHGEKIASLETDVGNLKTDNKEDHDLMRRENEKDHRLIRKDIQKLFGLFNERRRK